MKCGLCKFSGKTKSDLARHIEVVHKLTPDQYHLAAKSVQEALSGVRIINAAMKMAGML